MQSLFPIVKHQSWVHLLDFVAVNLMLQKQVCKDAENSDRRDRNGHTKNRRNWQLGSLQLVLLALGFIECCLPCIFRCCCILLIIRAHIGSTRDGTSDIICWAHRALWAIRASRARRMCWATRARLRRWCWPRCWWCPFWAASKFQTLTQDVNPGFLAIEYHIRECLSCLCLSLALKERLVGLCTCVDDWHSFASTRNICVLGSNATSVAHSESELVCTRSPALERSAALVPNAWLKNQKIADPGEILASSDICISRDGCQPRVVIVS